MLPQERAVLEVVRFVPAGFTARKACIAEGAGVCGRIEEAAIELLAAWLRMPLQIERHLAPAFKEAFRHCIKPEPVQIAEGVLSRQIDDLEPTLTRHGYDVRTIADPFNAKPVEIKRFLAGTLHLGHTRELLELMMAAGVSV